MNQQFGGWNKVAEKLHEIVDSRAIDLNDGQVESLREIAKRLPNNGVIIADEVGMGKTRITASVANAVIAAGGRVAILVPPGLGYQWNDELRNAGVDAPPILRSLDAYLNAWTDEGKKWGGSNAVLISHVFCNWSLKSNTKKNWRWALLPAVLKILTKESRKSGRVRVGTNNDKFDDSRIDSAAECICKYGPKDRLRQLLNNETINQWGDDSPLFDPANYTKETEFRSALEQVVGAGLGIFDLIIIDEAHKSRGESSGLNRLHTKVVLKSENTRCLAMTATPVELDATQWTKMLERILVGEGEIKAATKAINQYVQTITKVRQCPSDQDIRQKFKESAVGFQRALRPYVLRRDKRQEPAVVRFQQLSGKNHHDYRREQEIQVDTTQLSPEWKRAVCAAESLSFVTRQSDQTAAKRLRLTLGNGHGIAALIDQLNRDAREDHKQTDTDGTPENFSKSDVVKESYADKRMLRAEWWQRVMIQPFKENRSALFDHPAILAAVEAIEGVCRKGEKVLVFGRFTRPLRALMQLLNAREMLRCIDGNRPWPQSKVHENDEWAAVLSAHRQLKRQGDLDRSSLENTLADQYQSLENQRRTFREKIVCSIEEGFKIKQPDKRVRALFDAFKKSTEISEPIQDSEDHALAIVAKAIHELIGTDVENVSSSDFAQAFIDLVAASTDRDEGDTDGDGLLDEAEASDLWGDLRSRLHEEYNRPEGGYARLMYGETKPATRRFLQLAFNRKQSHPMILVAQSLVGREGLNLHKACRTVVLLHPEWNPGVVEQQIGRVDRIGSLWEKKLDRAIAAGKSPSDLPRIEIRPVVFQGTYDEKNWLVLRERWDDLRAQLHGVVITQTLAKKYTNAEEWIEDINGAAPDFSPGSYHKATS